MFLSAKEQQAPISIRRPELEPVLRHSLVPGQNPGINNATNKEDTKGEHNDEPDSTSSGSLDPGRLLPDPADHPPRQTQSEAELSKSQE
jgi:hypothetical protein